MVRPKRAQLPPAPSSAPLASAPLVIALGALAFVQLLHLLDDLRIDPTATVASELLRPQAIAGIGGAIVALVLVVVGHRWGRPLAIADASLVALGFLLVHGIPVKSGPTKPYWGEGSADAVQWLGVVLVWACCVLVLVLVIASRQLTATASGSRGSRLTSLG